MVKESMTSVLTW